MDTALVVAIIIGALQIVAQLASTRWQVNVARKLVQSPPQSNLSGTSSRATQPAAGKITVTDERPIPTWVLRLGTFLVNTVAVYFLYAEYQSTAPLTRAGVVFIASMVSVVCVCFLIPIIINIYDYIIRSFVIRGL
jgi:hypothetical protein